MNTSQTQHPSVNILLVDQALENLELLAGMLQQQGYRTYCVNSGVEALKIVRSDWTELILLDIQMPDLDGEQLAQELQTYKSEIPIIFTGASDDFAAQAQAFTIGGAEYIGKPWKKKEVIVKIRNQVTIQSRKNNLLALNQQLTSENQHLATELNQTLQQLESEIEIRQQFQAQLNEIIAKDLITGCANRKSLINRLEQAVRATAQQPDYLFALIDLKCELPKKNQWSISHHDSNQLLIAIANAINYSLPESALLCRLEGQEFGIFLDGIEQEAEAIAIAQKIQQQLSQPFIIQQRRILLQVNLGIALGNHDYAEPERLLNDASLAMRQVPESSSDRFQIFQPDMYLQLLEDQELLNYEATLKQAIKRQEFINYYLPVISLKTQRPVELEALVRWHHPQQGVITPQDFIDKAEEMGLMNAIGNLVMRQGCHHIKYWQNNHKNLQDLGICLNLSAKQLFHPSLVSKVDMVLRKSQIKGHHLKFEISETVFVEQPDRALEILQQLKQRQVRICLDNFGIGYSALTFLHRFPIDELKIDRSLIARLNQNGEIINQESSIVKLLKQIVIIAHQMSMLVTATGIENELQLQLLQQLGCDYGQGYLISQLLDRDSVDRFLLWSTDVSFG
ncbi:MAG: EAL domain-containing protein [Cyanobacteria bacterium P01_G01_bin.67]